MFMNILLFLGNIARFLVRRYYCGRLIYTYRMGWVLACIPTSRLRSFGVPVHRNRCVALLVRYIQLPRYRCHRLGGAWRSGCGRLDREAHQGAQIMICECLDMRKALSWIASECAHDYSLDGGR